MGWSNDGKVGVDRLFRGEWVGFGGSRAFGVGGPIWVDDDSGAGEEGGCGEESCACLPRLAEGLETGVGRS